ncbi:hypothetical protein [Kaistia nematophila]|uniref:Uncharacterized protein n=1 Tax=Kaistia nematophila TaxID=2994654 RepID=A0A9X3E456_9HYPH|nr:hypothetical protein [Kaistia nematophila]MCX5571449.1 hypothetical protein [Kaistia nematophila]
MTARIDEALAYLRSGGLAEVEGMTRVAFGAGSERVACSTDVAIALCMLASEAAEWPAKHSLRVAELLEANNRYLERARAADVENARLKRIIDACDWYWPEDDTSSDSCISYPHEFFSDGHVDPGTVVAISRGGVVETRYYAQLPPAGDSDSDDDFEVDEVTEELARRKVADELARRADYPQCMVCEKQLQKGDRYFPDVNGTQCEECAPTYQQMIDEPLGHVYLDDGEQRAAEDCRAQFDAHIAAGGKPTDSMATEVLE